MLRRGLVWLHRWTGLAMAGFLVIAGLTGTALAFNSELEHVFAPGLFAAPRPDLPALDLATLAERAEPLLAPRARVTSVLRTEVDQVQVGLPPTATLHMARVWGRPFQILNGASGLVTALLSATGVYIWWKKRGFRRHIVVRRARPRELDGRARLVVGGRQSPAPAEEKPS